MKKIIKLAILCLVIFKFSSVQIFSQDNIAVENKQKEITGEMPLTTLFLTCFVQGYYSMSVPVPVIVTLRTFVPPYLIVAGSPAVIGVVGGAVVKFPVLAGAGPFYVVVESGNMVETWSSVGVAFPFGVAAYDFSLAAASTFGANSILLNAAPVTFGSYVGDVNQDGIIDASDMAEIDNDAFNFVSGPADTDLNGDLIVDGSDAALCDNNAFNFVTVSRP